MSIKQAQLAMVIDSSMCIDCKGCMASCKIANDSPEGQWRNWVKHSVPDFTARFPKTHFQPGGCMHCDNPTCVQACPTGATYKDKKDGTVHIDSSLCIGCGNCIPACPYDARFRNILTKKADKCNFCAERREQGLLPACVDTCPTKARVFGDINDPESEASRLLAKNAGRLVRVVNAKTDTKPNMIYLGETAPLNWPVEAKMPTAMAALTSVVNPLVRTVVGLSGIGVAVMLVRQLIAGSDSEDDVHDESGTDSQNKGGDA
ncbi:4Fe-4S dicluster domain-containing protein [Maridesulfovibrio frigidus]|uniref:4Fe-4S dicluster domain-containing protein n=1 Tax=Maridesulfovibrio frigidus TaxID=340956 RepID=UPI0004E0F853|nr:4Fe-4S dicluster domain-containing protein [Maridesulfovibrio frigidus]